MLLKGIFYLTNNIISKLGNEWIMGVTVRNVCLPAFIHHISVFQSYWESCFWNEITLCPSAFTPKPFFCTSDYLRPSSLSLGPIHISSSHLLSLYPLHSLSASAQFLSAGELLGSENEPAPWANLGYTGGWRLRQRLTERPAFPHW